MGLQTGVPARNDGMQNVQFLRQRVSFDGSVGLSAGLVTIPLGTIPNGSIILAPISGVDVLTVFNAGTNNRANIGITGTTAKYASNSSLLTAGFVAMAVAVGHRVSADTALIGTMDVTGTAATTGDIEFVVAFVPPNN